MDDNKEHSGTKPNTDKEGVSSAGSIAKGSLAGIASQILYLGTRFILTPFVLAHIGLEAYGFWSILFVALGWFGLHRMGFASSAISYVARYRAQGRHDRVNAVLTTTATLGLGLCFVLGGVLIGFAEYIVPVLGTTPELYDEAVLAFRLTVFATFTALVLGGFQSVLEALQQFPRVKLIDASALMLEAVLIVAFLLGGGGLAALSFAYAIRMIAPIPVYAYYANREIPGVRAFPTDFDRSIAKDIFKFGGSIQGLGILHLIITSLERLTLAHMVSLAAAGSYELGRKLVTLAAALPTHALWPLIPAAADLKGQEAKNAQIAALLRTATRAVAIAAAGPLAFLVLMGPEVVAAWLGEGHDHVLWTLRFLSISAYIHLATGPATSILRGLALPKLEVSYTAIWLAVGAVLIPLGAMNGGLFGVAIGAAIAQGSASLVLLWLAFPTLGAPRDSMMNDLVRPAIVGLGWGLVAAALLGGNVEGASRAVLIGEVFLAAGIVGIGSFTTSFFVVLDERERNAIVGFANKFIGKGDKTATDTAEVPSA